ncbi:MAG: ABC transporter permease [Gemmatimonadota bacterium]|nr:MAG: ABC transporter permease [Gemmatimonadota bacterium]
MRRATTIILTLSALNWARATMAQPLPELLLENRTAVNLEISIGDTVWISGLDTQERPFVVVGTYRRPADPSTVTLRDYRATFHLSDLQELLGAGDRVDRFSVLLRPGASRDAVIAEIDRLAFGADALATEKVAAATSETFRVVSRFHRALAGITITGAAVFLLCLVVLKLEERRLEGASMRDVGISRRTLFLWMFSETLVMAGIGTAIGLVLGWVGSALINAYFRRLYDTSMAFARVTEELALLVAFIGLATGVVVGTLAGLGLVRSRSSRLRQL